MSCLRGGEIVVRGYPLAMVHAEKIVTALVRGTANTRWRDFADLYLFLKLGGTRAVYAANRTRKLRRHTPRIPLCSSRSAVSPVAGKGLP